MVVGSLEVHLRLEGCRSLKDKRRVLRPILERLRRDFHLSVAETGDNDLWNVATVGVACVGSSRSQVDRVLEGVLRFLDECAEARVEHASRDLY
jgi:uncharacterized protein YlxP (DUF503 family)